MLYTGRLVKDKHVDVLIDAIAVLTRAHPGLRCIIVGHGIERDRLADQIKRLDLREVITLREPLDHAKEVYSYMKAAKVFCLPSVREGFGIVALEALACGTPVVTIDSSANAAKDLITEGENGSVVPLNAQALAAALEGWISHSRSNSIAKSVQQYDWDDLAQAQAEVYAI